MAYDKSLLKIFCAVSMVSCAIFGNAGFALAQGQSAQVESSTPSAAIAADKTAAEGAVPEVLEKILGPGDVPKPIKADEVTEPVETRLMRNITLDVRDMNIIDVIKFLALKGDLNVVTSKSVAGRVTLYLKSVSIKDVLDIILISNELAYQLQNEIVYVMSALEYETIYGKKFSDKTQVSIVHLQYAKPSYVLAALDNLKSAVGKVVIDEDTGSVVMIDTEPTIAEMKKTISRMESPMDVYVYSLQYAKADVVAEKLKARLDANAVGSIVADERSNQVIVRALPGRREEVEGLIKSLDAKTKEVLIETRVLQVSFRPSYDAGIDWNMNFSDAADKELKKLTFKNVFLNDASPGSPLATSFSKLALGNIDVDHFQSALRALEQVSDTKILSNPKLLVTNNEEAKIHVGDTVPYIISTTSGTGDNAITSEDVRFVDVGLKLVVTPTINDDGFVTMKLVPEISTVVAKVSSKGGGIPQVNKTLVETTVMVKDGITIILAGLKKEDKSHTRKGLPILMNLPVIGSFMSATSDSITNTEIIIFLTPHIVTGAKDFSNWRGDIKPFKTYEDENDIGDVKVPLKPKKRKDKGGM